MITRILTHPGGAHKDDFLACCVLAARYGVGIDRREPTAADLADSATCVVDVGGEHEPARHNFDHHQFPRDHDPICALSLVLQHLGLYEDALQFCAWLEPAEWLDSRGPVRTAKWLEVERDIISKLMSPIDITFLRRFAASTAVDRGSSLHEVMTWIGQDLIDYLETLRERLTFMGDHVQIWELDGFRAAFMPRTEPVLDDPSISLARFVESKGIEDVIGLVYPDRRSSGYGLSRLNDNPRLDFTRIDGEADVHFAHASGFVAKSTATEPERLQSLMAQAHLG